MKPRSAGAIMVPRADAEIARTIETLRAAQFEQDPLFDVGDSFRLSLQNSAVKREGHVIEAAIRDAIEQTPHLRLVRVDRRLPRVPDVQFEIADSGWIVALEVKRGSKHDSTKLRQFRADLQQIPPMLRTALPLFPAECVKFHLLFVRGAPPLSEGITPDDLGRLYGLHVGAHVLAARQRYSMTIKSLLRDRGL